MSPFTQPPPPESETLRRALDHIHAHHTDPNLTATTLAATVAVTPRHLNRLFKQHLDTTPGAYLQRIRADTAAGLLTRTTEPVATVAAHSGFATTETLRRVFITTLGTPPSTYRRTHTTQPGQRSPD